MMVNTMVIREKLIVKEKNDLQYIIPNQFQGKFFAEQSDECEDAGLREFTKLSCIRKILIFLQKVEREGSAKGQCSESQNQGKLRIYVWTRLKTKEVAKGNLLKRFEMFNGSFC